MEMLVPAFLLAILSLIGDRLALLVAALGDRGAGPIGIALTAAAGHALPCLAAAGAALAMTPFMPLRAQTLFLAAALFTSGLAQLWPAGAPPKLLDGRMGTIPTALLAGALLGSGGATPLFVLALGLGGAPWLAAAGGALGALALFAAAALAGECLWTELPRTWLRMGAAVLLLGAGLYNGVSAAGLL